MTGVQETHGANEFGCDFICCELHRVFGSRYYGVVVKAQRKIAQGRDVQVVLGQIRQAFAKPIQTSSSPRVVHASTVLVLNSGLITDNAQKEIWHDLGYERYGANVVFLDGRQLQSLSQMVTADSLAERRGLLIGLRAELHTTVNNLGVMMQNVKTPDHFEPYPLLTSYLERVASAVSLHDRLGLHQCMSLLNALLIMRTRSHHLLPLPGLPLCPPSEAQAFVNLSVSVRHDINEMLRKVEDAIQSLA
jgi:hypothetical protein